MNVRIERQRDTEEDIRRQRDHEANEDALREESQFGDWRDQYAEDLGIPRSGEF